MGINSLLQALKTIVKPRNISDYANMTVAVDTYSWLHKGMYACATDFMQGRESDKFILYCIRKVEMLLKHNIKVVMVFDGGKLPMKRETEEQREKKRAVNKERGEQSIKDGERQKAVQQFAGAVDVTTEMAFALIKALREKKVECIVAPYEADAQLAYLSRTGYVDIVITEDSDLLAFGAKKIFYKMDQSGKGEEISLDELPLCSDFSFTNWTNIMFLTLCIMSGCDYVDQIHQVGFKTAYKEISRLKNYKLVISHFMQSGKYNVPVDYVKNFEQAFLTFRFQTVFDPISRKAINLNHIKNVLQDNSQQIVESSLLDILANQDTDFTFLGEFYDDIIICQIADGHICPIKLQPFPGGNHLQRNQVKNSSINSMLQNGIQKIKLKETLQMPIQQQSQAPQYGQRDDRQVFNLAKKPVKQKQPLEKSEKKQSTLQTYFKPKLEASQELIDELLIVPAEPQSTKTKKTAKTKPFKTPSQVPKVRTKKQTSSDQQEEKCIEDHKSTQYMEQKNQLQEVYYSQDHKSKNQSQSKQIQEPYQDSDMIMKGVNNQPIVLTREVLNRKLPYNDFGQYMTEKITFKPEFNCNY